MKNYDEAISLRDEIHSYIENKINTEEFLDEFRQAEDRSIFIYSKMLEYITIYNMYSMYKNTKVMIELDFAENYAPLIYRNFIDQLALYDNRSNNLTETIFKQILHDFIERAKKIKNYKGVYIGELIKVLNVDFIKAERYDYEKEYTKQLRKFCAKFIADKNVYIDEALMYVLLFIIWFYMSAMEEKKYEVIVKGVKNKINGNTKNNNCDMVEAINWILEVVCELIIYNPHLEMGEKNLIGYRGIYLFLEKFNYNKKIFSSLSKEALLDGFDAIKGGGICNIEVYMDLVAIDSLYSNHKYVAKCNGKESISNNSSNETEKIYYLSNDYRIMSGVLGRIFSDINKSEWLKYIGEIYMNYDIEYNGRKLSEEEKRCYLSRNRVNTDIFIHIYNEDGRYLDILMYLYIIQMSLDRMEDIGKEFTKFVYSDKTSVIHLTNELIEQKRKNIEAIMCCRDEAEIIIQTRKLMFERNLYMFYIIINSLSFTVNNSIYEEIRCCKNNIGIVVEECNGIKKLCFSQINISEIMEKIVIHAVTSCMLDV